MLSSSLSATAQVFTPSSEAPVSTVSSESKTNRTPKVEGPAPQARGAKKAGNLKAASIHQDKGNSSKHTTVTAVVDEVKPADKPSSQRTDHDRSQERRKRSERNSTNVDATKSSQQVEANKGTPTTVTTSGEKRDGASKNAGSDGGGSAVPITEASRSRGGGNSRGNGRNKTSAKSKSDDQGAPPAVVAANAPENGGAKEEKKSFGGRGGRGGGGRGGRGSGSSTKKDGTLDLSKLPPANAPLRPIDEDVRSVSSNLSAISMASRSSRGGKKQLEHSTQAQEIIRRLKAQEYECVICSQPIGRRGKIWSCKRCFLLMHQVCTQQWYTTKKQHGSGDEVNWPCPGCMFEYHEPPPSYTCFCGKVEDPDFNAFLTPHSCGQICGKKRGENDCPHTCMSQCHPGMCPPCTALGAKMMCPCGQTEFQLRCGEAKKDRPCPKVCSKPLSCGDPEHKCEMKCHVGACEACTHTKAQSCYCGKQVDVQRPCGTGHKQADSNTLLFACGAACDKLLSCGNHRCRRKCHSGPCFSCPREPQNPQHCACGRKTAGPGQNWSRKDCLAPLPLCGGVCAKPLSCLIHNCKLKCHDSPCPECNAVVTQQCYCGREEVKMPCAAYCEIKARAEDEKVPERTLIRCKKKCKVRLNCTQHTCGRECCTGEGYVHRCPRVCNKPLECGHHNCDAFCHLGYCEPCRVVYRNGLSCKCGKTRIEGVVRCGDPLPDCPFPCSAPRSCEHPCPAGCRPEPCPPCTVLVKRQCAGGHTVLQNTPCFLKNPTCSAKCGKPLACGRHMCTRQCHAGLCIADEKVYSLSDSKGNETGVIKCNNVCGLPRPNCPHPCSVQCHPGESCPDTPCNVTVMVTCECGRQKKPAKCGATNTRPTRLNRLVCDAECEVYQRNLRFRDALQITDAPIIPYPALFLDKVIHDGLVDSCPKIEAMFADLLRSPAKTKHLPAMQPKQRWLCHQLSAFYFMESESFDQGAQRAVRLLKTPRTIAPKMLLSEALAQYMASRGTARTIPQPLILDLYDMHKPKRTPADVRTFLRELDQRYKLIFLDNMRAILVFNDTHARQEAKMALSGKLNLDGPTEEPKAPDREAKVAAAGPAPRRSGDAWAEDGEEEPSPPPQQESAGGKYVVPGKRPPSERPPVPVPAVKEPVHHRPNWPPKEEAKPKPPANVFSILMGDDEAEGDESENPEPENEGEVEEEGGEEGEEEEEVGRPTAEEEGEAPKAGEGTEAGEEATEEEQHGDASDEHSAEARIHVAE